MLFGKKTIYFIAFNFTLMGWSMLVIYYIIFGDICVKLSNETNTQKKWIYIVAIGIILLKELLRKELRVNIKTSSKINFFGVFIFTLLLGGELLIFGIPDETKNMPMKHSYWSVSLGHHSSTSLSIFMVSYTMQMNLYPLCNNLIKKSESNALKSVCIMLVFTTLAYILIGLIGLIYFGNCLQSNLMRDIGTLPNWRSYVLLVLFLIVMIFNII